MDDEKKILVIDDEFSVRRSFELALEDSTYIVISVDSGEKGIEQLNQSRFDLVFLDLKMPGMNGAQTLREIRKLDSKIPVYIVTAFHKEFLVDLEDVRKDGLPFQLLRKPIGSIEILALAQSILESPYSF